jgi:hypothetical protein
MTLHNHQELIKKMKGILTQAQTERNSRDKWVESNNPLEKHPELGWVVYERQVMFNAVNVERAANGLNPIAMKELVMAETMTTGHSDYTSKFALYCAELAEGLVPKP